MKADLYVILNGAGAPLGAFSAEAATGGERIHAALAAVPGITVELWPNSLFSIWKRGAIGDLPIVDEIPLRPNHPPYPHPSVQNV